MNVSAPPDTLPLATLPSLLLAPANTKQLYPSAPGTNLPVKVITT